MLKLLDKKITRGKLGEELHDAGLPVSGVARLSRELDENGGAMIVDGKPKKVAPYLLIKGKGGVAFDAEQEGIIRSIVDVHIPDKDPTPAEIEDKRKEKLLNDPIQVARTKADAKRIGIPYEELRRNIKAELEV